MVAMGNERDVDIAYIAEAKDIRGLENPGDEVIVQIDTGERTKHLRVMLNEAILFDADPEVGSPVTTEVAALRSAATDLEQGLDGIDDEKLQRAVTAIAITVGWLRRRADRLEAATKNGAS